LDEIHDLKNSNKSYTNRLIKNLIPHTIEQNHPLMGTFLSEEEFEELFSLKEQEEKNVILRNELTYYEEELQKILLSHIESEVMNSDKIKKHYVFKKPEKKEKANIVLKDPNILHIYKPFQPIYYDYSKFGDTVRIKQMMAIKYDLGITCATSNSKVPGIQILMDQAKKYFKEKDYKKANKAFGKVLNIGEAVFLEKFNKIDAVELKLYKTKGSYFGDEEPTFIGRLIVYEKQNTQVAFDAIAEFARTFEQITIHISQILSKLPEGERYGELKEDGFKYEPNVKMRFKEKLKSKDYDQLSRIICNLESDDQGLAGSTLHFDKKGIELYNISAFKRPEIFINQVNILRKKLNAADIEIIKCVNNVRKLWIFGENALEANLSYDQLLTGQFPKETKSEFQIQMDKFRQHNQ